MIIFSLWLHLYANIRHDTRFTIASNSERIKRNNENPLNEYATSPKLSSVFVLNVVNAFKSVAKTILYIYTRFIFCKIYINYTKIDKL